MMFANDVYGYGWSVYLFLSFQLLSGVLLPQINFLYFIYVYISVSLQADAVSSQWSCVFIFAQLAGVQNMYELK